MDGDPGLPHQRRATPSSATGRTYSSNAWLEIQWYLFAAMVMLGGAYTLKRERACARRHHLRRSSRPRAQIWVDLFGTIFFLLPAMLHARAGCPGRSSPTPATIGEISSNAGGLLRWPVKILLPLGFAAAARCRALRAHQARRGPARPCRSRPAHYERPLAMIAADDAASTADGAAHVRRASSCSC